MARQIRIGSARGSVTMSDGLSDAIRQAIESSHREVADMLEAESRAVFEHARERWPVDTGASRDALRLDDLEFRAPRTLVARIYVDPRAPGRVRRTTVDESAPRERGSRVEVSERASPPARYIRFVRAKNLGGKNPWEALVRLPALQRHRKLAEDTAKRVKIRGTRAAKPRRRVGG